MLIEAYDNQQRFASANEDPLVSLRMGKVRVSIGKRSSPTLPRMHCVLQ